MINSEKDMMRSHKLEPKYQDMDSLSKNLTNIEEKETIFEKKYRLLFKNSPFPILLIDTKARFLDCNPTFERLSGYQKDELLKKSYLNVPLVEPEQLNILSKRFKNLINGKRNPILEIELYRKDKTKIWMRFQSSLVRIGHKKFIQIIGQNINHQKKTEKKLKESEEKYRSIIEASPNLIFLFDDKGTVLDCNKSAALYLELPRDKVINKKIYDLLINLTEEIATSIFNKINNNLKNAIYNPIEFSYKDISNQIHWYQLYYSIVKIGEKSYIHVELQDFTALKRAEEIIRKENKKLIELDNIRKKFLDTAAHELKTPLTSVYGALQLLYELNKNKLGKESLKFLEIAKCGSNRLKNLISNLLDVSRLESNNFQIHKTRYDIVSIIENCVKEMKYLFEQRNHTITLKVPKKMYLNIDRAAIERVIINLLSNAIKYTQMGGKISIKLRKIEPNIKIYIEDTGIGLTEKEIQKVFNKFSHIKRPKGINLELNKEGTGLGLNISKEIVELHGGQIMVESKGRNKGCTFIIRLPLD